MRAYLALHAVVRVLTRLLYRFELHGRPPAEGPYVLAANHESVIDPFVLGLVTRRMVHFLAKDELWRIAWVGRLAERLRGDGRKVVFTNGVFDLLHPGHVRYLKHARQLGDVLIVGVNSDRSDRKSVV